jgi:hypothetical protein
MRFGALLKQSTVTCLVPFERKELTWVELVKISRSDCNRLPGFIVNSVNGGYAVALGGYIAFLPKTLLLRTPRRHRLALFSIVKIKAEIKNIVVKEISISKTTMDDFKHKLVYTCLN